MPRTVTTLAAVIPGSLWTDVRFVAETGSTNDDVAALARAGAPAGLVVVAGLQTAGRGRLDRHWTSPAGSGLTFSVLLRPTSVSVDRWGWLPLLTGVAVASAVREAAGIDAVLKWPNDVLVDGRKLAGILVQRVDPDAAVVGVGLNMTAPAEELPAGATSLVGHGAAITDRDALLHAILRELAVTYQGWVDHDGDADAGGIARRYRDMCSTLGRTVCVELGGEVVSGLASTVDAHGQLVVDGRHVSAGDVVHLRR
jgi:BirA family transcriptional regulator, biotin operon repressor / biotin---[acetyl-CoA-carboxylase] ligase